MRGAARSAALAAALAAMTLAGAARAADPTDVSALEKELDEAHSALAASDCAVACKALASIRRVAERICALEPGPRCEAARGKEADATRRVREACPECVIADGPAFPPRAPDAERAETEAAPAPPEARGCRSCSTAGGGARPDLVAIALAVLLSARARRRRGER